jgi:beta-glucosidase
MAMRIQTAILCGALLAATVFATDGQALTPPFQSLHVASGPVDTEQFVERLVGQLSLEEKVGQMIQADIGSITPADLRQYPLGSILAGGNAAPRNQLRGPPELWLDLTDEFFTASLAARTNAHPAIPILFGIDAVHGHAKVRGATIFPHNVGLGAAHDPELIERIGRATAAEVAATGIDWTFAPTVAVVRDVRWGRSYESYSESPALVARYAAAMVSGLQGERGTADFMAPGHTLSSIKHFVGDGGTRNGRDQGNTVLAESELLGVHAAGYAPAIDAGAMIVMASYNSWNGVKLHGNRHLLTDVLKGRMGFKGFVVGDWNAQEQVPGCTKFSCAAAILAGVDMLMAPDSWRELYRNTLAQVRSGAIPQARIDDAVRRILRVKAMSGLFDRLPPKQRSDAGHIAELGSAAHRAIAREAVRKSLVLLKNAGQLLPLDPHAHVLVAGAAADDIGRQCGGWTVDWQGDHNTNADFPGATSIYAGIQAAVTRAGGTAILQVDGRFTDKPDVAVVVFGEEPYAEFEGDRETLAYAPGDATNLATLQRLRAAGIPTVTVFLSGRPLWVNREINASDAFVAAWLPGSEGGGIADVLFRTSAGAVGFDFTGRLAFSWPNTAMPVTFAAGDRATGAVYGAGFGLDYKSRAAPLRLPESPQLPAEFDAPSGSLFFAGHPTAPWSLFVADAGEQVHVTNRTQRSPHDAIHATLGTDGVAASWNGSQQGVLRISGRAADLKPAASAGTAVVVRYRIDHVPEGSVAIGLRCTRPDCGTPGGALLDATPVFRAARVGTWQSLVVPVACWRDAGANLASVEVPFEVETAGKFALTVAEVRLQPPHAGAASPCLSARGMSGRQDSNSRVRASP